MPRNLRITRIVVTHFSFVVNDLGPEEHLGFDQVYRPGYRLDQDGSILTIETDAGITGEVPGSIDRGMLSTCWVGTRSNATPSGMT